MFAKPDLSSRAVNSTKPRAAQGGHGALKRSRTDGRRRGLGYLLVILLLVDAVVELQLRTGGIHSGGSAFAVEIDEGAGLDVARVEGELALPEVIDLRDLQAGGFEIFADGADELLDRLFFAFRIEDDEGFVLAFHMLVCGLGLNRGLLLIENVHRLLEASLQGHRHGISRTLDNILKCGLLIRAEFAEHMAHHAITRGAAFLRSDAHFEAGEVLSA